MVIKFEAEEYEKLDFGLTPINVAKALIEHSTRIDERKVLGIKMPSEDINTFSVSELRQIAEHLLVYCNHNSEEDN